MEKFIETLEKEVEKKLRPLEHSHLNVLKKSSEASLVPGNSFQLLKEFIDSHIPKSVAEEIVFFKIVKPRLYNRLIYYRKVYNHEMNRTVGMKSQRQYADDALKFRAISSWGGCNANDVLWRNNVFDLHSDESAIEWIRKQADGYETSLKAFSDSLMQESIKS